MFIGLDIQKATISGAIAQGERGGEIRHVGAVPHRPDHVRKLAEKPPASGARLHFSHEAGPCGYGQHRQLVEMGHDWIMVASPLIPVKSGDRVKTDRRDAVMLAKLHRAGDLTSVRVPDPAHEAARWLRWVLRLSRMTPVLGARAGASRVSTQASKARARPSRLR
ncbi:hypothetical protein [Rhodosalinus sp.]|uniref:hypothetical protein n=1 Tax=Rhodosalinus sp. TaxID=2047741 RepID=UPI0035651CE5